MSGIYETPDGQKVHGDGKPVGSPASTQSELSPAICSASRGETKRNCYGYLLDELGQPKCPHCGESTNKAYREMPNLKCWNCGREMTPSVGDERP